MFLVKISLILLFQCIFVMSERPTELLEKSFMYFAYGSNLLAKRIHIKNPTAIRKNIGQLKDYRLDFYYFDATRWNGSPATVVPEKGRSVWGAIWEIDISNMDDLDRQEGVNINVYKPISVPIETPEGEIIMCRMYLLINNPSDLFGKGLSIPFDRKPSRTYIQTIIQGAIESELPEYYIQILKSTAHNGRLAIDPQLIIALNINTNSSTND